MRTTVGGSGGIVICLGLGAMFDLEDALFSEDVVGDDGVTEKRFAGYGGVECWVVDARRPWDLGNVFGNMEQPESIQEDIAPELVARRTGVNMGKVLQTYKPGRGGVICFDDGDIEAEMQPQQKAFYGTMKVRSDFPDFDSIHDLKAHIRDVKEQLEEVGLGATMDDDSDDEEGNRIPHSAQNASRKRKSWSDDEGDSDADDERPPQRRRSNSVCSLSISPAPTNACTVKYNTIFSRTTFTTPKSPGRLLRQLTVTISSSEQFIRPSRYNSPTSS